MNEQLKITITADTSKLKQGCQEATKAVKDVGDSAEQMGSKGDSAFTKLGNAAKKVGSVAIKAFAASVTAASAGVVALTKSAVQGYAEYEQLVGGIETLFKDSAGEVQKYAADAYKTAGISANKYMEQATSFSASLLQSLGGDTAEAAKYADMAIIDMSDNANKMGTSIEMIQNAYQGFAKQNFTMLDNLKLGYGGTKAEMERLIADANRVKAANGEMANLSITSFADITEAIHIMQTEMGITGTTALEANNTISGSLASMKSAWSNLVVGIADDNANFQGLIDNFVETAGVAMGNLLPRIQIALEGIGTLIRELLPIIMAEIPMIITNTLPQIAMAGVGIVVSLAQGIGSAIMSIGTSITENAPAVMESITTLMSTLGAKIQENLPLIVDKGLDMIVGLASTIGKNLPKIIASGMDLLKSLVTGVMNALPSLIEKAPKIINNLATGLNKSFPVILSKGVGIILEIIKGLIKAIPTLISNLPQIIMAIVNTLTAFNWLGLGKKVITGLINGIKSMGSGILSAAKGLVTLVTGAISGLVKTLIGKFKFKWSLPKLKLPKISISGKFSLSPPSVPKFSISWNKLGGVFDKPTLFSYGNTLQGIGEDGAEAVVPLEKNTQWLDRLADRLAAKQNGVPIVLQIDGKTFAQVSIDSINSLTRQRGKLGLNLV